MITLAPAKGIALAPRSSGYGNGIHLTPDGEKPEAKLLHPWELAASQELDPLISLFFGRRGDGKTLCMTAILSIMLQCYLKNKMRFSEQRPEGFKLATNYHVQFADFNNPMLVDMLSNYDERMRRIICGIDEILSFVPSRRTMSRANLDFANSLIQIRKLDIEIVSATQKPQNIDSQMLDQIDLFILPLLYNKQWIPIRELWSHKMTGKLEYKPTAARLMIWDWWGSFTGKQYSKRWPPQMSGEPPDYTLDLHNIHELFSWFSTKEQVPSLWHSNRRNVIGREWAGELEAMAAEFEPDIIAEEGEGAAPATVTDLINAQPNNVMVSTILDAARLLDKTIKSSKELAVKMEGQGFHVVKEGRYGYRALRLEAE